MSLSDLARKTVQEQFKTRIVGEGIGRVVTFKSKGKSGYNATTGQVIPGTEVDYQVNALLARFSFTSNQAGERQRDDQTILAIDWKILIPFLDLPVEPKIGDQIVSGPTIYRVIGVQGDPIPAVWIIHARPLIES